MKKVIKKVTPPIFLDILKNLKFKIGNNNIPRWYVVKSGPVKEREILVNSNNIYYQQMIRGVYDSYLYEHFDLNKMHNKIIIDVGSHIGYHTLGFSNMVGNDGKVYAIDPNPFNLDRLAKIKDRNSIENIYIKNVALSDRIGKAQFAFSPNVDNMTSSGGYIKGSDTPLNDIVYKKAGFINKTVRVITLDNLISEDKYKEIALLKIDVEGHEANVLRGCVNILKQGAPIVLVEIHTIKAMYDVSEFIHQIGYKSEIVYQEEDGRLFLKYYKN